MAGFIQFPPINANQECDLTEPYLAQNWAPMEAMEPYISQWSANLKTLALYTAPFVGTLIKINDGIINTVSLSVPQRTYSVERTVKEKFEDLEDRVGELRVNDGIFLFSRVIHAVALLILTPINPEIVLVILCAELFFTGLVFLYRKFVARAVTDELLKTEMKEDGRCCNLIYKFSNENHFDTRRAKNLLTLIKDILIKEKKPTPGGFETVFTRLGALKDGMIPRCENWPNSHLKKSFDYIEARLLQIRNNES